MTHENSTYDSAFIVSATNILHEYWDKIVQGEIDDSDIRRIRCALYENTKDQVFSRSVAEFLGQNGTGDKFMLSSKMRNKLVDAMTEEFLQHTHPITEWTHLLSCWQVFDSFELSIKGRMATDTNKCVQIISKITAEAFEHPECLLIGNESERFLSGIEQWKKENDIRALWAWGAGEWYPYDGEVFRILLLLLPGQEKTFLCLASLLKSPMLLYELLAGPSRAGVETLLSLLQVAPTAVDAASNMQWNKSWVAPVLLDDIFQQVINSRSSGHSIDENEKNEIKAIFTKTGEVLNNRSDGLFLVWSYIGWLYSGIRRNQTIVNICVDAFRQGVHVAAKEHWPSPDSFKKIFSEDVSIIEESFRETGILKPKQECSACMELLTCIQFFLKDEEYVKESIPYLEVSFMFEDDNIQTYEASPQQCHFVIADMYLTACPEKAVDKWMRVWELFAMARYRSQFDYYDKKSIAARKRLDFLLLIAIALLNRQYDEKKWESFERLWEKLWGIMVNRMQFKWSKSEEFNEKYVRMLFSWKAMQLQKQYNNSDEDTEIMQEQLIDIILRAKTYPEIYLCLISFLEKYNLRNAKQLPKKQITKMLDACRRSVEFCREMNYRRHLEESGKEILKRWKMGVGGEYE